MNEPMVVQMTIDRMKYSMLAAIDVNMISAELNAAIDKACESFCWESTIKEVVHKQLRGMIESCTNAALADIKVDLVDKIVNQIHEHIDKKQIDLRDNQ